MSRGTWRDGSANKSTGCSAGRLRLDFQHPPSDSWSLVMPQCVWLPLLPSVSTAQMCYTGIHTVTTPIHTKQNKNKIRLKKPSDFRPLVLQQRGTWVSEELSFSDRLEEMSRPSHSKDFRRACSSGIQNPLASASPCPAKFWDRKCLPWFWDAKSHINKKWRQNTSIIM